jgi:hypothetical protein
MAASANVGEYAVLVEASGHVELFGTYHNAAIAEVDALHIGIDESCRYLVVRVEQMAKRRLKSRIPAQSL